MKRYAVLGLALPLLLSPMSVYANQKDVISLPQSTEKYTIFDKDGNSVQVEFEHNRKEIQVVVSPPSHTEEKKVIVIPLGKDQTDDSGSDGDSDDEDDSKGRSNPPVGEKEGALPPITYEDIEGHWAKPDIIAMVNLELIQGYPDGTFRPNSPISRAEFATLLERVLIQAGLLKEEKSVSTKFSDVFPSEWYYPSVSYLEHNGNIPIEKYSEGKLYPNAPIIREEMALWLSNEVPPASKEKDYKDSKKVQFVEEVHKVTNAGLLQGYPDGTFKPQGNTTRAEAVTILMRFMRFKGLVQ